MKQYSAAIFGASGYSGGELIRILSRHPHVALAQCFANTAAGSAVSDVHGWYDEDTSFTAYTDITSIEADICFLALPHGEAMKLAPELLAAGKIVIDLSGDHRIADASVFQQYYKFSPTEDRANGAVYGLPEWNATKIKSASLIANPGCYATSIILPLLPFLVENAIEPTPIVVNSMSGVSGAGRKANLDLLFTEIAGSVKAYKVGDHQHIPEIENALTSLSGEKATITFIPHLIPIARGIYTTITATMRESFSQTSATDLIQKYYGDKPFVRVLSTKIPEIRNVIHTNTIEVAARVVPSTNQLILISTIDNLIKGAAGQAVQNMNIACGFPEQEGLQ